MQFLNENNLIHRDIKPQNLLLTAPLPMDEINDPLKDASSSTSCSYDESTTLVPPSVPFMLKIADFGFARHLESASLAETLCGSPLYMAPEILQHQRYVRERTESGDRVETRRASINPTRELRVYETASRELTVHLRNPHPSPLPSHLLSLTLASLLGTIARPTCGVLERCCLSVLRGGRRLMALITWIC